MKKSRKSGSAIRLYTELLRENGDSHLALNWGSKKSQHRRFQVLSEIGLKNDESVLDVGCGLAHFYDWLRNTRKLKVRYHGIDMTPMMIQAVQAKYPRLKSNLATGVFTDSKFKVESFDYVFASGIFYLEEKRPLEILKKTVRKMFALCRKGVAFNSLSSWIRSPYGVNKEFRADPLEVVDFCRELSPRITLRHDYHPGDFTIYLLKEKGLR